MAGRALNRALVRAPAAGARRRGELAGLEMSHEQLGQFHVVQQVVGAQQWEPRPRRRVVAASGGDDVDAVACRLVRGTSRKRWSGPPAPRRALGWHDVGTPGGSGVLGGVPLTRRRFGPSGASRSARRGPRPRAGRRRRPPGPAMGWVKRDPGGVGHRPSVGGRERLEVGDEQVRLDPTDSVSACRSRARSRRRAAGRAGTRSW